MNYSRKSYTNPSEKECVPVLLDLRRCEFCQRTFLPSSLTKHKKLCYQDFLKKKSKASMEHFRNKSGWLSPKDKTSRSMSDIMMSRRVRRMNWRDRHEHFIQVIRSARDNAIMANNGIILSTSSFSLDHKEDLRQCKHCLRNFHKDAIMKHSILCKEHSIQSNRFVPNDAHTEAKRRMSLRLYYKPKSFRQDATEDLTTTSSLATDCSSIVSINSKISNDLSRASSRNSLTSLRSRTLSVSNAKINDVTLNSKLNISNKNECQKLSNKRQQSENRKIATISNEMNQLKSSKVKLQRKKQIIQKDITTSLPKSAGLKNSVGKDISVKKNISNKERHCRTESSDKTIAQKLKVISNILRKTEAESICYKSYENINEIEGPDPSKSFSKAKEVLQFLNLRFKENQELKKNIELLSKPSNKDMNINEKLTVKENNNIESTEVGDVFSKKDNHIINSNDNLEEFDLSKLLDKMGDKEKKRNNGVNSNLNGNNERATGNVGRSINKNEKSLSNLLSLISKKNTLPIESIFHHNEEYMNLWHKPT